MTIRPSTRLTPIDAFIDEFNRNHNKTCMSKMIHGNPKIVRSMQVASGVLALGTAVSLPFLRRRLSKYKIYAVASLSGLLLSGAVMSKLFTKYVACAHYEIGARSFQEGEYKNDRAEVVGKLSYKGNIPTLTFFGKDSYQHGKAHGSLLGGEVYSLHRKLSLLIHKILGWPKVHALNEIMQKFKELIPYEYLREMQGLADGCNEWNEAHGKKYEALSQDDLFLIHLVSDFLHFYPGSHKARLEMIQRLKPLIPSGYLKEIQGLAVGIACTVILDRDPERGVIFGRNMDWPPLGDGGTKTLVTVWKDKGVAGLGMPGVIGVITGWNRKNLSVAMNVCPGKTNNVRGIPSLFFNRYVLERASTVAEVKSGLDSWDIKPLGPYHMNIADRVNNAASLSFYQGDGGAHYIRDLKDEPIFTVNWRYPKMVGSSSDKDRSELLTKYYKKAKEKIKPSLLDRRALVENALKLTPVVNLWMTMHSLTMLPGTGEVTMKWDNGYAASQPGQQATMDSFF